MGLFYQEFKNTNILTSNEEILIPIFNNYYEEELKQGRIIHHSKYDIICEYTSISSKLLAIEKDIKLAIGFGMCFPSLNDEGKRIIMFPDLIDPSFMDICISHEYAHLIGGDEKEAFTLELKIAEIAGLKEQWLEYNEREYPWRMKHFQNYNLI